MEKCNALSIGELKKILESMIEKDGRISQRPLLITTNDESVCGREYVTVTNITQGGDWEKGQIRITTNEPIIRKHNSKDVKKDKLLITEKYTGKRYARCSSCNGRIARTDKYCKHCGQRFNEKIKEIEIEKKGDL